MKLSEYLNKNLIFINKDLISKKSVLEEISKTIASNTECDEDEIFSKLYEREKLGTTALGNGIAIPHARIKGIENIKIMLMRLTNGIDFDSLDGGKVDIIVSLVVPNDKSDDHVHILASIAELLENKIFRAEFRNAKNIDEIVSLISNS